MPAALFARGPGPRRSQPGNVPAADVSDEAGSGVFHLEPIVCPGSKTADDKTEGFADFPLGGRRKVVRFIFGRAPAVGIDVNFPRLLRIAGGIGAGPADRDGGRIDLAENEEKEAEVLSSLIPKEPTEAEIEAVIKEAISAFPDGYAVSMRDMKTVQMAVKEKYPTANGGLVANAFRKFI